MTIYRTESATYLSEQAMNKEKKIKEKARELVSKGYGPSKAYNKAKKIFN